MLTFAGVSLWLALAMSGRDRFTTALTNEDVVRLVRAEFAESVIVQAV
jgi:hypothetical protein